MAEHRAGPRMNERRERYLLIYNRIGLSIPVGDHDTLDEALEALARIAEVADVTNYTIERETRVQVLPATGVDVSYDTEAWADGERRHYPGVVPHAYSEADLRAYLDNIVFDPEEMDASFAKIRADARAEERAKRPDREQIAKDLFEADGRRNYDGSPTPWHILDLDEQAHYRKLADAVLSSLALEPEAREEKPPVYLAFDVWAALRLPDADAEFDGYYELNGWADTWSNLLAEVRLRSGARPCGEDAGGEPCVLSTESHLVHYGASDVGSSEPLPAPEAREVTDAERQRLGWLPSHAVAHIDAREQEHIKERVTVNLWPSEWEAIKAELAAREVSRG